MLDLNSDFIYKLLLQEGSLKFDDMLKKSGFDKNKQTNLLNDLISRGYVLLEGKFYKPVNPMDLLNDLIQKKKDIDLDISNFEAELVNYQLFLDQGDNFPHVKVYRGVDSMTKVYEEAVKSEFWRGIVFIDEVYNQFEEYLQKIFEELSKNGKDAKDIFIDTKIARKVKNQIKSRNYQIRLLPVSSLVKTDLIILKDKVFFLSYVKNEMLVVEMKSKSIVELELLMFDNIWNNLKDHEA